MKTSITTLRPHPQVGSLELDSEPLRFMNLEFVQRIFLSMGPGTYAKIFRALARAAKKESISAGVL